MSKIMVEMDVEASLKTENLQSSVQKCCKSIDFYRELVKNYMIKHDFESSLFWADKIVSLTNGAQEDVYLLAQTMYFCGHYHRAAMLLQRYHYERTNLFFRLLAAKSWFKAKEFQKALDILDLEDKNVKAGYIIKEKKWEPDEAHSTIMGQICLLRGNIYEALMNIILATKCYKEALNYDVYCYEAFHLLTQHQMLSKSDEISLIDGIPFATNCSNGDADFVKFMYKSKTKKYTTCGEPKPTQVFPALKNNLDILAGDAERAFYDCDFLKAYQISQRIIKEDSHHAESLPVYIACLVEMKKVSELFQIAHKLVSVMSDNALSWYSIGSYYYIIGKQETARRHLNKSLSLDPLFGPSWLLFGHSFAVENEHDQAMAAYFKATQLMKGCHLPILHVGLECGLSNNPALAMKFLDDAKLLAPRDPFIRHEMGVVKFFEKRYEEAYILFMETVEMIEQSNHRPANSLEKWEPLFNNIGHCLRKMERYEESIKYHQRALVLCPSKASTYSAIGLIHAIKGNAESALKSFHKALSFRRDDAISTSMLRYVIEKMVEDTNEDTIDFN